MRGISSLLTLEFCREEKVVEQPLGLQTERASRSVIDRYIVRQPDEAIAAVRARREAGDD